MPSVDQPVDGLVALEGDLEDNTSILLAAYRAVPTSIVVLSARNGSEIVGVVANSFTSISTLPPLISVCIRQASNTWPLLDTLPRLGVSVLAADQAHLSSKLASRAIGKFGSVSTHETAGGAIMINDAAVRFECSVQETIAAGDHFIVVMRVHALLVHDSDPLVYHGSSYRRIGPPIEM